MRQINKIIIHCSDTPETMDIGAEEIYDWHVNENGWSDIGYHYIVRRSGIIEVGRMETVQGAHCSGENADSIGICMVGRDGFTGAQFHSLRKLKDELELRYPNVEFKGHYNYSTKTCPNFSVEDWLEDVRAK